MTSEAGMLNRKDGAIDIIVVTQAGAPNPDYDASVPSISYELVLHTHTKHLDADLVVFRTLLMAVKIAPQDR